MSEAIDFGLFEVTIDVSKAVKDLAAFKDKFENDKIYDEVGKAGVEIIQKLLDPLKRTGKTSDSFSYKRDGMSVVIFSEAESAYYIQTGFTDAPSTAALQEWMNHKAEFSGLSESEAKRVAFAIQKSIREGRSPGPASSLGPLQPSGQRKFDYLKLATEQIQKMVQEKVYQMLNEGGSE